MEYQVAYEPNLVPPPELMATEMTPVLEDWFRWGEEWSVILRSFCGLRIDSTVLEIGCGLGRIAFPLRYVIMNGQYRGFDITKAKIDFLQNNFTPSHKHFEFEYANIHNTYYNPSGLIDPAEFVFPYSNEQFDIVFAASVFTHLAPRNAQRYFFEAARVLKKGGTFVASFFVLDFYEANRKRLLGFSREAFNVDHRKIYLNNEYSVSDLENSEFIIAYSDNLIKEIGADVKLDKLALLQGFWSGKFKNWVGAQDIYIYKKC